MNKRELAESIYRKLDIKRFEAYSFIDVLLETVTENLCAGKKVVMSNFGAFKVVERQKKKVLNPNNREVMVIPGRKIVKFYPSKNLKQSLMN
ncbi:MAG: DNA-binding protein HU-beta [Acidobacteriota bacterium]|nr:DNA-binding protein HU-beta [Acidobacteriota bacterium]